MAERATVARITGVRFSPTALNKRGKMKLQKANAKDFKEMAEIYKAEFSNPPWSEKWNSSLALKKIKDYSTFCDIGILKEGRELIGFIIINTKGSIGLPGEVCFGEELVIKCEYQREGFGTFILKKVFNIYKKKGFKRIMGIAYSGKLLKFYKKLNISPSKKYVLVEGAIK